MADSRYTKTLWQNGHTTPLNQTNLNKIENELDILDAESATHTQQIEEINTKIGSESTASTILGRLQTAENSLTNVTASTKALDESVTKLQAATASLNTTASSLDGRLQTTESDIGTLKDKVAVNAANINTKATQSSLDSLSATVSALSTSVNGIQDNITDIKQDITDLEQKVNTGGSGGTADSVAWENITGKPTGYTPTSHAVTATTYGVGTVNNYGHVKISNGDVDTTSATDGVAAGMDHTHSTYATKSYVSTQVNNNKVTVVNDLVTDSTTSALSAAQGKALKAAIDGVSTDIGNKGDGDMLQAQFATTALSDNNKSGYVDNAINSDALEGHPASYFATATHNHDSTYAKTSHNHDTTYSNVGHTHGDYVNQNAYSNIVVGSTTIAAGSTTGTLTLVAGSNVTLSADATNKKVTINSSYTDKSVTAVGNHYTPATSATYTVDATATSTVASWGETALVTGVNIQHDAAGHITGVTLDSIKMPNNPAPSIATSATAGTVKSGGDITVDSSGNVTVTPNSHAHTIANVTGLQDALDGVSSNIQTQLTELKNMLTWQSF